MTNEVFQNNLLAQRINKTDFGSLAPIVQILLKKPYDNKDLTIQNILKFITLDELERVFFELAKGQQFCFEKNGCSPGLLVLAAQLKHKDPINGTETTIDVNSGALYTNVGNKNMLVINPNIVVALAKELERGDDITYRGHAEGIVGPASGIIKILSAEEGRHCYQLKDPEMYNKMVEEAKRRFYEAKKGNLIISATGFISTSHIRNPKTGNDFLNNVLEDDAGTFLREEVIPNLILTERGRPVT